MLLSVLSSLSIENQAAGKWLPFSFVPTGLMKDRCDVRAFVPMCGRDRLTKRRMLEIEDYYGIDDVRELDLWQREFNIPPTEVAPIIFDHKGSRHLVQARWGLISSGTESNEEAKKVSTFNA